MNTVKDINYKLWLVLILTSFTPLIYSTTRIHLLGEMPDPAAFSIASQIAWLNLGYEILSEALGIPLIFILGQVIKDKAQYQIRVSTSFVVVMSVYLLVTVLVLISTPVLVTVMGQEVSLVKQTVAYIRLESVAIFISGVYAFFNLVLLLKDNQKALYALLVTQTVLILLGDWLFVS